MLYPLKFNPIFKEKIWGGNKLKTVLNKDFDSNHVGESWEISAVDGSETLVSSGDLAGSSLQQIIQEYKSDLIGEMPFEKFGDQFPLLIKFIDAKTPLSVQVHPQDEIAKKRHNSFGKNEMWYIMNAEPDAEIIVGFEKELNKTQYLKYLENNQILEIMHHEKVRQGDAFYIPTGRIHAIGSGVILAEIQQASDITYRIFDYNRIDETTGQKRELHNDLAIDVLDFKKLDSYHTDYEKEVNKANELIHTPYFKSNFLPISGTIKKSYKNFDSFVIYMCVKGQLVLHWHGQKFELQFGETILLPAIINDISLESVEGESHILEVYL
uniref:type I phosphomannose isomerase catalytic subunit n=1 Tax=Flavobacterium sp. TaxID=239 RepID=UPI0040492E8E